MTALSPPRHHAPQRDSLFIPQSPDPSDVLDHATSKIPSGSKLGIDATKKIPGEGFNPNSEVEKRVASWKGLWA